MELYRKSGLPLAEHEIIVPTNQGYKSKPATVSPQHSQYSIFKATIERWLV